MLSRRAIEDLEAIVRSIAVNDGTYPKPQSRTRCDRTGSTARPTAPVRPHRSDRASDRTGPTAVRPYSSRCPTLPLFQIPRPVPALSRAPARAHAPINFGSSKPGLRGSARSALASLANAPVWRSVFGSKVSHGPTT